MTQHTVGPWAIGKDGDVWACDGTHCVHLIPDTLDAEANARLIAAAPELLAAAANLLSLNRTQGVDDDAYEAAEQALDAAITKATQG